MEVCRICLSQDGKLYPFSSNGLGSLYRQLAGIPNLHADVEAMLPQWVCAECGLRLLSYNKLRQKILRSHQLLCKELNGCYFMIDEVGLKQIDREKYHLQSNYTQHTVKVDYNIIEEDYINLKSKENKQKHKNSTKMEEFVEQKHKNSTKIEEFVEQKHKNSTKMEEFVKQNPKNSTKIEEFVEQKHKNSTKIEEFVKQKHKKTKIDEFAINLELDETSAPDKAQISYNYEYTDNNYEYNCDSEPFTYLEEDCDILDKNNLDNANSQSESVTYLDEDCVILDKNPNLDDANSECKSNTYLEKDCGYLDKNNLDNGNSESESVTYLEKDCGILDKNNLDNANSESESVTYLKEDCDISDENTHLDNVSDICELSIVSLYDLVAYTNVIRLRDSSIKSLSDIVSKDPKKQGRAIKKKVDAFINKLKKKDSKRIKKEIRKEKVIKRKVSKKRVSVDPYPIEEMFTVEEFSLDEQKELIEKRKYSKNYIESSFKCEDCNKGFIAKVTFERHRLKHSEERGEIECEVCKQRFSNSYHFNRHLQYHTKKYSCKICKFTTFLRHTALSHGLSHKGKSFQCPHCGLMFSVSTSFFSHLRIKHVSNVACEYCGYSFINTHGLLLHKKRKHKAEMATTVVPADGPTCATCDIKFVSDEALNKHARISHPRTPNEKLTNNEVAKPPPGRVQVKEKKIFKCSICEKEFANEGNRIRHMIIHSGLRPFACETCGGKFKSKCGLKAHHAHVHLKVPWPKNRRNKRYLNE